MRYVTILSLTLLFCAVMYCSVPIQVNDYILRVDISVGQEVSELSITEDMIEPVMKIVSLPCSLMDASDEEIDPDADAMTSGSVVFVSDVSQSLGTATYPHAYIFFTAKHVLQETVTRHNHHPDGQLASALPELVRVRWQIETILYDKRGDIVEVRWIDLCEHNLDTKLVIYRLDNIDCAIMLVSTADPMMPINSAHVAHPVVVDDMEIGDSIYLVGCQVNTWPWIRTGILSRRERDDFFAGSPAGNRGDSGGAIYDSDHRLIGLAIMAPTRATGVIFIPISAIYNALLDSDMTKIMQEIWR